MLSEVGLYHVDHLIGCERLLRIRSSLRVKHMVPDVAFQEFGHQAINCASGCADNLQHLGAIPPLIEESFQSLKLSADALAA